MARRIGTGFNDDLFADPSGSWIEGLAGNDLISGNSGDDMLSGGGGNDVLLDSQGGADRLYGGAGRDLLQINRGGPYVGGPLLLDGGADDDVIRVHTSPTENGPVSTEAIITGGTGNDRIEVSRVTGTIDAGAGNDAIYSEYSPAAIAAGPGNDFVSFRGIDGTAAVIDAGTGADTVQATVENADATIVAGDGNDDITLSMQRGTHQGRVDLGPGDDRATAHALTADVFLSVLGGAGNDTISAFGFAVEARGGSGNDHVTVAATSAVIDAGSGLDVVTIASEGDFIVTLGDGPDRLELDALFTHSAATDDYVRVTDFRTGNSGDVLDLSGALGLLGWTAEQGDPFDAGYARLREFAPGVSSTFVDLSYGDGAWFTEALLIGVTPASLNAHNLDGFTI